MENLTKFNVASKLKNGLYLDQKRPQTYGLLCALKRLDGTENLTKFNVVSR